MEQTFRAAIVGTGWIAALHAEALKTCGIELAAVIGHSAEGARSFAERWGAACYGTSLDLLWSAEIECVHICTPPATHFDLLREVLAHGKHVLCEKPLCLCLEEAEELAELAERSGLVCAVGFNIRYYAACQKARELVASPEFGRVLLLHGSYLQEFGAEPAQWSWRYADRLHAVTEIGSHWLDLAQFVSGLPVTALSAQLDRFHPTRYIHDGLLYHSPSGDRTPVSVPSEDVAVLSLRFGGALGSVVLSELSHGRGNRLSLEITGEHQSLWWDSESPDRLTLANKGEAPAILHFEDSFSATFCRLIGAVYTAIGSGVHCGYPDIALGRDNVRLCELAWESGQRNSIFMEV